MSEPLRDVHRDIFRLDESQASSVADTFRHLISEPPSKPLALALRRFTSSYQRDATQDRLVDFWIVFEALFAPDQTDELRFRASLRIARLIGSTEAERRSLFAAMRSSYELPVAMARRCYRKAAGDTFLTKDPFSPMHEPARGPSRSVLRGQVGAARLPVCGERGSHRPLTADGSRFAHAAHELGDRPHHKLRVVGHQDVAEPWPGSCIKRRAPGWPGRGDVRLSGENAGC